MTEPGRHHDPNRQGHRTEPAWRTRSRTSRVAQVWIDIGEESGDPFRRCALAHSIADVQDDEHHELVWDLRALKAADERAAQAGVRSPVAGFYPSLHLNLGECYRKLGDLDRARAQLERGQVQRWLESAS
jgi:hypothetical protein